MAHFAEVNAAGIVTRVVVVADSAIAEGGAESEAKGVALLQRLLGGEWVQTSYNGARRGKYAGVGDTFDRSANRFVAPPRAPKDRPGRTPEPGGPA